MIAKTFIYVFNKIMLRLFAATMIFSGLLLSSQAFSSTSVLSFVLAQNSQGSGNVINVRLSGATDYELVETFGKVLSNSKGVLGVKRHGSRIIPENPSACFAIWRVRAQDSDPSRLQANIIKTIRDFRNASSRPAVTGNVQRFTSGEVDPLKGIRPLGITGNEILFTVK